MAKSETSSVRRISGLALAVIVLCGGMYSLTLNVRHARDDLQARVRHQPHAQRPCPFEGLAGSAAHRPPVSGHVPWAAISGASGRRGCCSKGLRFIPLDSQREGRDRRDHMQTSQERAEEAGRAGIGEALRGGQGGACAVHLRWPYEYDIRLGAGPQADRPTRTG